MNHLSDPGVVAADQTRGGGRDAAAGVLIELSAAIVAVTDEAPKILLVRTPRRRAEAGRRSPAAATVCPPARSIPPATAPWKRACALGRGSKPPSTLGYLVEQLYTFGDRFRDPTERAGGPRPVSVGYLALVRQTAVRKGPV